MADLPPYPDTGDDTGVEPDREPTTGMARWQKVVGVIGLGVVLLIVVLLLTTGGHGPGRHSPSGDTGGPTPPSSVTALGGVGGPADAAEAVRTVEVTTLDTMTFEPSRIDVSAGETITFVVTNTGQAVHEFTLGDAAMQQDHADMMAHMPDGAAHEQPNSITLQPGETNHLTWRFGDVGTIEYACHEPGHYPAGMRGQITIT